MDEEIVKKCDKIRLGQRVWWRGNDVGSVTKVDRIENQFGTVVLGFEVTWAGALKGKPYTLDDIGVYGVWFEKRIR